MSWYRFCLVLTAVSTAMALGNPASASERILASASGQLYATHATISVRSVWQCAPQNPIAGGQFWFRTDTSLYGPFYSGSDGLVTVQILDYVGNVDVALITCSTMEDPSVIYDVHVSNGDALFLGKMIGCICPPLEYSADNPNPLQ